MTEARWALILAVIALAAIALHAMIPTPPAHTRNPLNVAA